MIAPTTPRAAVAKKPIFFYRGKINKK